MDAEFVDRFNIKFAHDENLVIHSQVLPEPFVGHPDARLYVLGLNPGYSDDDDVWHTQTEFRTALLRNLLHGASDYPFYFLNPELAQAPGSKWWTQRTRWLAEAVGTELLCDSLCCVELFPYHSRNYRPMPKRISANGLVPSSDYSVHLVRSAMNAGKLIVMMRGMRVWEQALPELAQYPHLVRPNSVQNMSLSPGNLREFDQVVAYLSNKRKDQNG